jgi:hypothetical protein
MHADTSWLNHRFGTFDFDAFLGYVTVDYMLATGEHCMLFFAKPLVI